jgi:conjugative relaxase-like TrwC/TraI family protein
MLRMQPIASAAAAEKYYARTDGGYYLQPGDVRQEWVGSGAKELGLTGAPDFEQFKRLLNGLDPHTGEQLTALLVDHRLCGLDMNVHCPKGVTTAINRGDERLEDAFWASMREAVAYAEASATTRVRQDGRQEDRLTGNLVGYAIGHNDTRPAKDDNMPDWHEHIHVVLFNVTKDGVENQWKAVKFRALIEQRKLFDRYFNQCFSRRVADLGYDVETHYKPDGKGGRKYSGWDIGGIPASVIDKTSRRSKEVAATEQAMVAEMKARDANAPDHLSELTKDKLGATTRQRKREDVTPEGLRAYWDSRLTPEEGRAIAATIDAAKGGGHARPENRAAEAMAYAVAHHFERNSVVGWHDLVITAMEKSMGAARPEDFLPEARRQGVLFQGGEVTTRAVLEQEQRITGFARAGRGTFRPLAAAGKEDGLSGLSDEQKAAVRHVWRSTDQIILVRGGAGTGKTTMMAPALAHLNAPAVLLAPSSDASRGQLRKEGFADANTVAAFLGDAKMQAGVRRGVIWVDEAGLLGVGDLDRLCGVAKSLEARIVLQGDPKQHKAVSRHGNMLTVLEDYAGLPVAKLDTIQRQRGEYAQAVAAIRDGKLAEGDAALRKLGWIVEGQGHDALVAEYARAIEEGKANGERKTVLVVNPTHKDGDALTEKLRAVLKEKGLVGQEEKTFRRLVPLNWTDAEKADARHYGGDEVIQFYRNAGRFKAGDRVKARDLVPHLAALKPSHFAVYGEAEVSLASGDTVRVTSNGRDVSGKHRIDNGRIDRISGFTRGGDIVLSNGWILGKDFAHIKPGLVQTSHATQSKTDDIVLASMNRASLGAMGAEQGYVTVSRGRERGMIFTDLPRDELLSAIARQDRRKSATELLQRKPEARAGAADARMARFMEKVRTTYRQLQDRARALGEQLRQRQQERERGLGYAR